MLKLIRNNELYKRTFFLDTNKIELDGKIYEGTILELALMFSGINFCVGRFEDYILYYKKNKDFDLIWSLENKDGTIIDIKDNIYDFGLIFEFNDGTRLEFEKDLWHVCCRFGGYNLEDKKSIYPYYSFYSQEEIKYGQKLYSDNGLFATYLKNIACFPVGDVLTKVKLENIFYCDALHPTIYKGYHRTPLVFCYIDWHYIYDRCGYDFDNIVALYRSKKVADRERFDQIRFSTLEHDIERFFWESTYELEVNNVPCLLP